MAGPQDFFPIFAVLFRRFSYGFSHRNLDILHGSAAGFDRWSVSGPRHHMLQRGHSTCHGKDHDFGGKFMEIWNLSEKNLWTWLESVWWIIHFLALRVVSNLSTNKSNKNMGQGFTGSATWKKCRSNSKVLAFKVNFHVSPRIRTRVCIYIHIYIHTHI